MKLHKTKVDEEIYYYFLKNGEKRWMYRHKYYDGLGKRREKKKSGFRTDKSAYKALLKVKADLLDGNVHQVESGNMKVSQLLDIWYETKSKSWEISTRRINKNSISHLKKYIGKYKVSSLTSSTYEREFINKMLDEGFKPGAVVTYHESFKTAINFAIDDEILTHNRFSKIKIQNDEPLDNFLTPEELTLFLDLAEKYGNFTQYTLTLLLAYSGMRKGEAQGLKWRNINFKSKTVTIECTRDDEGERSPKTKNSYRTIEIDDCVIHQLKEYQKCCIEIKLSFGTQLDKEDDYVFITESGKEIYASYINKFFKLIYQNAKTDDVDLKRITPHGLRHTHATILIDELIPPTDIADRLGNTLEMIYRVYAHSFKKIENKSVIVFGTRLRTVSNRS